MQKKMLFILNPISGMNRPAMPLLEALDLFSQANYLVQVRTTTQSGDATAFVESYGESVDLVVCSGGDGTLNETISGLMKIQKKPQLGYLPRGTTNDFANSMGLSANPVEGVKTMLSKPPRTIDAGLWNGRSFVYVASFGAFTRSSYAAPQAMKNVLGHFAYVLAGITNISSLRPYKIKVEADGEVLDGEYLFGAVCNSTSIGGIMQLSADMVTMDDGLFELLLIPSPQSLNDLHNLVYALSTQSFDSHGMIFRHVSAVHIETEQELPWALDGEYGESAPVVDIVNHPRSVEILG